VGELVGPLPVIGALALAGAGVYELLSGVAQVVILPMLLHAAAQLPVQFWAAGIVLELSLPLRARLHPREITHRVVLPVDTGPERGV